MSDQNQAAAIAKLTVFRVYYQQGAQKLWPLFNNGQQRIKVIIEIEARDSGNRPVLLSEEQLNSIRLCETHSNGTVYRELQLCEADDKVPSDSWGSYSSGGGAGYIYDPSIFNRLTSLDMDEAEQYETLEPVPFYEPFPLTVQRVELWVATTSTNLATIYCAAKFDQFVSTLEPAGGEYAQIGITPKRFNQGSLKVSHQEVMTGSESAHYHRGYNNYISATVDGYGAWPLKYIFMPGMWWDRGDAWHTEFSFCYCGHAGGSDINLSDMNQPMYLGKNDGGWLHISSHYKPSTSPIIGNPRPDQPVVVMILSNNNYHFYHENGGRPNDKFEVDGDVTDAYGNKINLKFGLNKSARSISVALR